MESTDHGHRHVPPCTACEPKTSIGCAFFSCVIAPSFERTSARRVFSFIFRDRTLDLEFSTEEECKRNLRLFKVLVAEASK